MDKKSFAFGFLSAIGFVLLVSLWLHDAPVVAEAATSEEALRWCQYDSAGYEGSVPTGFDLKNTWAIMTAGVLYSSGTAYTDRQASERACEILYNIHHPPTTP